MKRIVILAIVGGLILGLLLPTGLLAKSAPGQGQSTQAKGPVLLTIAENLTLSPAGEEGDMFISEYRDVTSFRLFKLYARLTPYVGPTPWDGETQPPVRVRVLDSPLGTPGEGSYGGAPMEGRPDAAWGTVPGQGSSGVARS